MSTGNNTGSNAVAGVDQPDNVKAVGAHIAVIPDDGVAQTVNPADQYSGATFANLATKWVRARIAFSFGISGNNNALQQVVMIPPNGFIAVDFNDNPHATAGEIDAIEAITLESVALPEATGEASALPPLTSGAAATIVINFATA